MKRRRKTLRWRREAPGWYELMLGDRVVAEVRRIDGVYDGLVGTWIVCQDRSLKKVKRHTHQEAATLLRAP